jgi:hypothetical protein
MRGNQLTVSAARRQHWSQICSVTFFSEKSKNSL